MRLKANAGPRHLTLAPAAPAPMIGIADAVALAAARGPGSLPPGIATAVLRLAFGRGAASRLFDLAAQRGRVLRISQRD